MKIALSILEGDESRVELVRRELEPCGYAVAAFTTNGVGGRALEACILAREIAGVLDLTTNELADELVGGSYAAGRDRLTAAALRGIPQVIALGALDRVTFGAPETIPDQFRQRRFHLLDETHTLMRTSQEENDLLGKEIAHKASAARGPTAVLVPLRGLSKLDREGQPFWQPEANAALFQSLQNWMSPHVQLIELDLHVDDEAFTRSAIAALRSMKR